MSWSDKYISPPIPFKPRGRDFSGCDCGGLVLLVLKDHFDIEARDTEKEYEDGNFGRPTQAKLSSLGSAIDNALGDEWHPVSRENSRPGDLVIFAPRGIPCHVGLVVSPGKMIHVEEGSGQSMLSDIHGIEWGSKVKGYYRHAKML